MANGFLDADGDGIPDYLDVDAGTGTGTSVVGNNSSGNTGSWGSQSTPQEWLSGIGTLFQGAGSLFSAIKFQPNPTGGGGFIATPESQSTQKIIGIAVVILVLIVTIIIIRKMKK